MKGWGFTMRRDPRAAWSPPVTTFEFPLVPRIREVVEERIERGRAGDRLLDIDVHARVGVILPVADESRADRLELRIPVRPARLEDVADAAVEVVAVAAPAPEG